MCVYIKNTHPHILSPVGKQAHMGLNTMESSLKDGAASEAYLCMCMSVCINVCVLQHTYVQLDNYDKIQ